MTARLALVLGAVAMAIAVALGAFGAHALKARLSADTLDIWRTGVTYHAWHALALIAVGLLLLHVPDNAPLRFAAWLFVAGIVLFAGSLYALALGGPRGFAVATPFGGLAFIAAWIVFAIAAAK
jgi:uncharacterized membrane protein YgdD (TMEM256/DUF423 family)